ncbi:MAG: ADP-ribosylglycohydrolase family protein [Candidatus Adiutrix sp.]|jgi:ADP-ribosylglycohydrolase|nr:ADP-ribosylglycohydrolase family protein [Candidatus Adiutrix sp.]
MLGAIIGDITGSVYEFKNVKTKDFPLLTDESFFTDDTVMTIAVAEALMNGGQPDDFIDSLKKYGRLYPRVGYGRGFYLWLVSDDRAPYGSWGNGAAMRVSPCGWFGGRGGSAEELAERSAAVTHDHTEGLKGARATAAAIDMARAGRSKAEIRGHIEKKYGYDLSRKLDDIRPGYKFDESCQGTVPEAIIAFLESDGFEDALRNAVSLGGDSDTLAAITGGIAEAAYGIPQALADKGLSYLDRPLRAVYDRWRDFIRL